MEKEKLMTLLIDYIDGTLSSEEKATVEQLLIEDKEASQLHRDLRQMLTSMDNLKPLEMSSRHIGNFEDNLKREIAAQKETKVIYFSPVIYRVAAAIALVMLGLAGGFWINKNNQNQNELAALRKEMAETKQVMMAMLGNNQSASQRMQGVNVALSIAAPDDDIVNALEKAMVSDPNTNVRLAALEALSNFVTEPKIRKMLAESLSKQGDPMVQIALIQLLVRIKEKGVLNDLEKIIKNKKSIEAVKNEAYTGILKLS